MMEDDTGFFRTKGIRTPCSPCSSCTLMHYSCEGTIKVLNNCNIFMHLAEYVYAKLLSLLSP